ncbi:hypothetical protein F5H01DRAFT_384689 [Linnemannia elongata]|nr:hypothetical protein F5H01DRAFT_384689 [Linnemannia elongata]
MLEPVDSSTRITNVTANSIVNSLPELIELIGKELLPTDLVACVQNLTANWDVLLETAAAQCRNLTSLTVHGVRHILPEHFHTSSPSSSAADSTFANNQPPSLELPWIKQYRRDRRGTPRERRDMEWFWQLVLQNPGLIRLHFPETNLINILPQPYILETVSRIKNLRELNTRLMDVDLSTLLDTLPQLERLSCSPFRRSVTLSKNYSNLRQLEYLSPVQVSRFIEVLKHLPRLESLMLSRIIAEEDLPTSTYEILCETVSTAVVTFPQVREFEVHRMSSHEERYVAMMLGVFPEVRRLYVPGIPVEIRKVMWEKCYWLEEFRDRSDRILDEWKERRVKDAAGVRFFFLHIAQQKVTIAISALNPSTTTLITNATGKVIALPELIEHIVHYIPPTDLLTCTQVSRL